MRVEASKALDDGCEESKGESKRDVFRLKGLQSRRRRSIRETSFSHERKNKGTSTFSYKRENVFRHESFGSGTFKDYK